jgi:glycosyltransferase involved in cell wall biosynthesis
MHIVFIHRGVYPERIGGTYSYIYELGRRLAARGHRIRVIASTRESEAPAPYEHEGMLIHKYAFRRMNPVASTLQHLRNSERLLREIAAKEPVDILTIHEAQLGYKAARSALGRSVCQLPTFHAPVFLEFRFGVQWELQPAMEYWQRKYERGVLEEAHAINVLSKYSKSHIANEFPSIDLDRVHIIPGGVDADRFRPAADRGALRAQLGIDDGVVELLTVRKLAPRMGLENLVKAMPHIVEAASSFGQRAHLTVCGDGALMPMLRGLAAELGVGDAVTLAGRVTDDDLVQHYQASDLFILPTAAMEGFGISTVEALSTNLPVVGTPAGATPEILRAIDPALLTRDTSAEAIAEAVTAWLGRRGQESGTDRYRQEVLAKYSWGHVTDLMEAYYREQLEAFRRRPL